MRHKSAGLQLGRQGRGTLDSADQYSAAQDATEPPRILGDLLADEIAEKRARSIKYQLTIAKLPLTRMSTTSTSPARRSIDP
jgi:hypothetical protein